MSILRVKQSDGTWMDIPAIKGAPGPKGEDGTPVTVKSVSESTVDGGSNVVTFSDGKTVTIKNGSKGTAGKDGKTPVNGTDYWTDADQESIVQQVISTLQTPVFGRVDENNVITLTGALASGKYTFKYEDADGNLTVIGTIGHDADKPNYTNQIPISVDTDGTIFNGTGYMAAKRINSSHAVVDLQNTAATNPAFVTGLIPIKDGDVFRFKNCFFDTVDTDKSAKYGFANWNGRMCFYDSGKQWANEAMWTSYADGSDTFATAVVGSDGLCYELTFKNNISSSGYKYIRFMLAGTPETAIITVNEPIE